MERNFQHTIKKSISRFGLGLHSGLNIKIALKPWIIGGGVVFKRSDLKDSPMIPALAENVVDTKLATTIGKGEATISTIEHLMAAIRSLGLDNILVEVSGPELPVFDGSALAWVALIKEAGLTAQMAPKKYYRVTRPFRYEEGDKWIEVKPGLNFSLKNHISFTEPIGRQSIELNLNPEVFEKQVAPARTFCLAQEIEYLRSLGLAKGGSLANAVVVGANGVLNSEGLRFDDEFVRHKALDFIGDIGLAGATIMGQFTAFKSGHEMNHKFLTALMAAKGVLEPIYASECMNRPAAFAEPRHISAPPWGLPGSPRSEVSGHLMNN